MLDDLGTSSDRIVVHAYLIPRWLMTFQDQLSTWVGVGEHNGSAACQLSNMPTCSSRLDICLQTANVTTVTNRIFVNVPDPKKPAPSNIPKKTSQAKETSTTRMTTAKMMPAKFFIGSAGPDPGVGIKPGSVMEAKRMKSGRRKER